MRIKNIIMGLLISLILISNVFALNLDVNGKESKRINEKGLVINAPKELRIDSPTKISFTITNITDKEIVLNRDNIVELTLQGEPVVINPGPTRITRTLSVILWSTKYDSIILKPGRSLTRMIELDPEEYSEGSWKLILNNGVISSGLLGKTSIDVVIVRGKEQNNEEEIKCSKCKKTGEYIKT